jgi:hypothetical protein
MKPLDQRRKEELIREFINTPPPSKPLDVESLLHWAIHSPKEFDALILLLRETPVLLDVFVALSKRKRGRGRPRKPKDRGFSGYDPALDCLGAMDYLHRTTGETKAETLARTALDELIEGGFVTFRHGCIEELTFKPGRIEGTVKRVQYWTFVERLARLWKERVDRKREKTER